MMMMNNTTLDFTMYLLLQAMEMNKSTKLTTSTTSTTSTRSTKKRKLSIQSPDEDLIFFDVSPSQISKVRRRRKVQARRSMQIDLPEREEESMDWEFTMTPMDRSKKPLSDPVDSSYWDFFQPNRIEDSDDQRKRRRIQ